MVELYLHSPTRHHDVLINYVRAGITLTFYVAFSTYKQNIEGYVRKTEDNSSHGNFVSLVSSSLSRVTKVLSVWIGLYRQSTIDPYSDLYSSPDQAVHHHVLGF
jgi:hypothetical protein